MLLERWKGVEWIHLARIRTSSGHVVNLVMNLWVHKRRGISWLSTCRLLKDSEPWSYVANKVATSVFSKSHSSLLVVLQFFAAHALIVFNLFRIL
jgi:hypothetical protein